VPDGEGMIAALLSSFEFSRLRMTREPTTRMSRTAPTAAIEMTTDEPIGRDDRGSI
jgi:hypothetical protein